MIIVSYVNEISENFPLDRINQKAIAIFEVFAVHIAESLLEKLKYNNIQSLYVPAVSTDKLQPVICGTGF